MKILLSLLISFVLCVPRPPSGDDILFADFEDPAWPRGWVASADFPYPGPVTLAEYPGNPLPTGFGGQRFVTTLKGDGAHGTLTSPEFQITKKFIHMSLGGGDSPDECFAGLYINGERVLYHTGDVGATLSQKVWDVQKYIGQTAQIKLVDNFGGAYGFLLVDDIYFSDVDFMNGGDNPRLVREIGYEGTVLLENKKNCLPLPKGSRIALFGNPNEMRKGGGGSGEVYSDYGRSIPFGLQDKEREGKISLGGDANVAIICFNREAGEMYDRQSTKGEYYLSDAEQATVNDVISRKFERVIVILNVGMIGDSTWFKGVDGIDAVLMIWFPGQEGGVTVADILVGDAYPSGKLADTMAKAWTDYSSSNNWLDEDFMNYEEDIYNGYRYFETIPGAAAKVNYEFGFGLGYTTFAIENIAGRAAGDNITITATVHNTGNFRGKEVVQVYVGAPQGKLGKPAKVLAGFQKTKEIAPGGTETVTITFPVYNFASYDDLGKVVDAAYILEPGDYHFFVGNSVRNVVDIPYRYHVDNVVVVQQLTHNMAPTLLTKRLLADGTYENLPTKGRAPAPAPAPVTAEEAFVGLVDTVVGKSVLGSKSSSGMAKKGAVANAIMLQDVAKNPSLMGAFLAQISTEDLCLLSGGKLARDTGSIGDMPEFGIPPAETNDGPAGARISAHETHFPSGTMIACTWNPDLAYAFGLGVADEMIRYRGDANPPPVLYGTSIWLAPGLNVHRNPLCGRNFEYYSEDPLLAGKTASGVIRGHQSRGCATTPKHFAGNEREFNRGQADSRMSERAAREIYLKNFEIAVREGDPWSIMTSYNVINGQRPTQSVELLTNILRKEWGFSGFVMTDWTACCVLWAEIVAGNNVAMPWGDHNGLDTALADGRLTRERLEQSVAEVLNVIMKLHVFKEYDPAKALEEKRNRTLVEGDL